MSSYVATGWSWFVGAGGFAAVARAVFSVERARRLAGRRPVTSRESRKRSLRARGRESEDAFRPVGEKLVPIPQELDVARAGTHAFVSA